MLRSTALEGIRTRLLITKEAGDLPGPARHDMSALRRQHAMSRSTLDDVRQDCITRERLGLSYVWSRASI